MARIVPDRRRQLARRGTHLTPALSVRGEEEKGRELAGLSAESPIAVDPAAAPDEKGALASGVLP